AQPVEEARPELALHLGHVLREGGLAQVHGLRGRAEASRPGHGQKDLELSKGRWHKSVLILYIRTFDLSLCKGAHTLSPWTWRGTSRSFGRRSSSLPSRCWPSARHSSRGGRERSSVGGDGRPTSPW